MKSFLFFVFGVYWSGFRSTRLKNAYPIYFLYLKYYVPILYDIMAMTSRYSNLFFNFFKVRYNIIEWAFHVMHRDVYLQQ